MKRFMDNLGSALSLTVVVLLLIFLLLPIVVSVAMSFDARPYMAPFPPHELSLRWYEKFITTDYYIRGLKTSIILAIFSAVFSTAIGVSAALFLNEANIKRKELLSSFFLSPMIVPGVVIGFSLLLFFSFLGIYDGFVRLILGHVLITVPYTIRTTLAGLVGIPKSITEAALSLGANERQAFWKVTFPLAKTGIVMGAIFAFIFSFDDVAVSMFLMDPKAYTLPVALVSNMRSEFDLTIAAAAVLLVASTAVLIFALDRTIGLDRIVGQGVYRG